MTNVTTAANAEFGIGTKAAIDESSDSAAISDFENDTYTAVGEVESIGNFGDEINSVTFTGLRDQRVRKFKGSRDAGTAEITVAFRATDSGQSSMQAAVDDETQDDFNFRVTINDGTSGGSNTVFYFSAKAMSDSVEVSSVDNIVRKTYSVAINTAIYEVEGS